MLKAVVFDMDGVLIDSEPLWQEEEQRIFGNLGINLTAEMQEITYGLAPTEMIEHWYNYKPWNGKSLGKVKEELLTCVNSRILEETELLPGAERILDFFMQKGLKIGLASSSPMDMIRAIIERMGIRDRFDALCTAEDEEFAKPHPAVYLAAMKKLEVHPSNSMAVEDSFLGLLSAKAARMKVLVVPDRAYHDDPKFGIADLKLRSLQEFNEEHFSYLDHLN